ncbi:hypothetical protein VTL71DRAFT_16394 [Oculimacula yallundae]|uniref:Uncharacterized protein n=1 Tax=Oculimacula yallundae TaxID=86028 RepID=A0ABR4CGE8_9HELO
MVFFISQIYENETSGIMFMLKVRRDRASQEESITTAKNPQIGNQSFTISQTPCMQSIVSSIIPPSVRLIYNIILDSTIVC